MITATGIRDMKTLSRGWKTQGKRIGFVPTMGFLHEGHLSLVRESKRSVDVTVVSIFINPTQFGPQEDFDRYPRDIERDRSLLEREGADCLFLPEAGEIYPPGYRTYVEVHGLQDRLCGRSRPGHFRGVATVVLKLFNIVSPDVAFFGWKDAQQAILLRRMAEDLDCDTRLVMCPIVREADGLAMSSRNSYLSPEERSAALVLSRSLAAAEQMVREGERDPGRVVAAVKEMIQREPLARVDYVEIVDEAGLEPAAEVRGEVIIALAVYIGRTRLIDNVRLQV